ncbi:Bor family protein [Pantoea sp. SIMBA_133]
MMKSIALIILAIALTGCARQSFDLRKDSSVTPAKEETHHFFISGLGQEKSINAAEVCGGSDKVSRTETQLTFMNGFLNIITFGIYTPRDAIIYCSK